MKQHERDAFETFARTRARHLFSFGYALTGSQEAAADLVQEALARTAANWGRITSADPEGYVRRVMINTNVSWWRRSRETPTDCPPEGVHEDASRDEELWNLLATLPTRQRAVLVLRYYEDLSEAQIADVLGCSVGTVKSQAARALDKLRAVLATEREPT